MKKTAKYFLLFLLLTPSICSVSQAKTYKKSAITLQIISPKDTFVLGQPMVFIARITNVSKRNIFIQDSFSVTSNIYPNGANGDTLATGFHFELQPIDNFGSISAENDILLWPEKFIQLAPNNSKDFVIDISRHILALNKSFSENKQDERFLIKPGSVYKLIISYDNIWQPGAKRLKRPLQATSQQVTFFLSQ